MNSETVTNTAGVNSADEFHATDRYRCYVLGLLLAAGIFSWVDRQIFAILLVAIKHEFHFSDTRLGLLGGIAFGLFYASVGLPVAWLADRFNRRNIIAVALGLWSAGHRYHQRLLKRPLWRQLAALCHIDAGGHHQHLGPAALLPRGPHAAGRPGAGP